MTKEWPRRARVVAVYPGAHAVDVEYLRDRGIAERVPVMAWTASSTTGVSDLPFPDGDKDSGYTGLRDMTAIVDLVDGAPLVMGFVHSRTSQVLFDDQERRVVRHASDVYTSIDKDGNVEFSHPSGTFFRFGVTPEHEDLTGKNHDENWSIERNTDKAVHANLEVWNGGEMKAKIHIDPDGNLVQYLKGNMTQTIDGGVTQKVTGDVTQNIDGNVDITTPKATVHGDAEVTGSVKMAGGTGMCVTTESLCAFLGAPHPDGSTKVTAGS